MTDGDYATRRVECWIGEEYWIVEDLIRAGRELIERWNTRCATTNDRRMD